MKPQTKPNDVASKLRAAKALIATPETWCQDAIALDKDGNGVSDFPDRAVRWCAGGAWCHITGEFWPSRHANGHPGLLLDRAAAEISCGEFTDFVDLNNATDHATVMKMFDRAIELAEAAK